MAERAVEVLALGADGLRLRLLGSACDGCSGGCGGRCNLFGDGEVSLPWPDPRQPLAVAPQVGQQLRLVLDDGALRGAAWRGYGHAWLGLLLGAAAGRALALLAPGHADLLTLAGLASGTFLAVVFSKRRLPEPRLHAAGDGPSCPHRNTESTVR